MTLMPDLDFLPPWFLPLACALIGACIGSFLNVVIYRLPQRLSVNKPSRSFCPDCKTTLPWKLNIPLISWLLLKGKCKFCGKKIPIRYWLVEVMTALLFGGIAWVNADQPILAIIFMCLWCAVAISIAWIDAEHMLVFPSLILMGTALGIAKELIGFNPLAPIESGFYDSLTTTLFGAAFGYILIKGIILLGRAMFGKWDCSYPEEVEWELIEPRQETEELLLRLPDRDCLWSDLFARPGNTAHLRGATASIDGNRNESGDWTLTQDYLVSPSGKKISLADIHSAKGTLLRIEGRREAMGGGDAWIMMMIGSICCWQGVLFSLFIGSLLGIITGIASRRGWGNPIPFGPSLLTAAVIWLLGGHALWTAYMDWVMG